MIGVCCHCGEPVVPEETFFNTPVQLDGVFGVIHENGYYACGADMSWCRAALADGVVAAGESPDHLNLDDGAA